MPKRLSPDPRRPAPASPRRDAHPAAASPARLDEVRRRLEGELAEAENRIRDIDAAPAEGEHASTGGESMFDETDHIHQSQAQEIRFATRQRLADRAGRIRMALDRLERGEYGLCVECGEPIGRVRLKAMPEVERCVRCQERAERRREPEGGRAA